MPRVCNFYFQILIVDQGVSMSSCKDCKEVLFTSPSHSKTVERMVLRESGHQVVFVGLSWSTSFFSFGHVTLSK